MDASDRVRFKHLLQRRRAEILRNREASERGVIEVREGRTDPEYEEGAQADHVEYTLGQLSDSQQRELAQVEAALARIDAGSYGECVECGQEIPLERLIALPFALLDAECAARREESKVTRVPTL